jgi:para-nitrobenzyl esterase
MKTSRRKFIQRLGVGAAGLSLVSPKVLGSFSAPVVKANKSKQVLYVGDNIAVTDTTHGKVRGYILRDIYHFLGMPYGADTSGENRFMPAKKPKPWTDIFPALKYGNPAPQIVENLSWYTDRYNSFINHDDYTVISEDCLRINVWTPGYKDGKKRPVLVWLHGGGYTVGNGNQLDAYKGENFSRYGDLVYVSLNHRLGSLGFSDFSGVGGDKFAASENVGMLDIVSALEWVRDNIENFGGDPGNVTIMGQSGGGGKVCLLTAMPSAKGLFHKAVVLSGATTQSGDREASRKLGSYILKGADLTFLKMNKLQELPWKDYIALANTASTKLREDAGPGSTIRGGFSPVVDGYYLPQHPYYPEASPLAADIPMIICSTFCEQSPASFDLSLTADGLAMTHPEATKNLTLDDLKKLVSGKPYFESRMGKNPSKVMDAYKKAFPDTTPMEILSMSIFSTRQRSIDLANVKSKQPAPVYLAWFGWDPPLFDNQLSSFHTLDICFWFYNTDFMLTHTGGGERPKALSEKMAGSLVQFMKTGNPNGGGLPAWPKFTANNGETMILNDICEVRNDPDREARKSLQAS